MELATGSGIAGLVLAGGEGRRIGGSKALVPLDGRPLVQHAVGRLAPQVETLWMSVGRDPGALAGLGYGMVTDDAPETAGPLAGIVAGLRRAAADGYALLAVVPCDAPFLPGDLVSHLRGALGDASVAAIADDRLHATISLWRTSTLPEAAEALDAGRLRLGALCRELGVAAVPPAAHWPAEALFNVNTREDLLKAAGFPTT